MEKSDLKAQMLSYAQARAPQTPIHLQALHLLEELEIPTTKHEEWKYLNLKNLLSRTYTFANGNQQESQFPQSIPNICDNNSANVLTFVNGVYRPELSCLVSPPSELTVCSLLEAKSNYPNLVDLYFGKYANADQHIFAAFNTALEAQGVFVYVPNNKVVETPVVIRCIACPKESHLLIQVRHLIVVGRSAQLTLVEHYSSASTPYHSFTNLVAEVIVLENAHLQHYKIQDESATASHIGLTQVWQLQDSYYANTTISLDGELTRNNLHIALDGQNCQAYMNGLYVLDNKTVTDNHTVVDHRKPNSSSNELYKGILKGKTQAIFNGKIFVRPNAQKTNAFQSNKNILLSPNAQVDTKPQLEIWADDVKCSHGCTVGALDEEPLFYLRTRGIDEENARALLIFAFAQDVLERIELPSVRQYVEKSIAERLKMNL